MLYLASLFNLFYPFLLSALPITCIICFLFLIYFLAVVYLKCFFLQLVSNFADIRGSASHHMYYNIQLPASRFIIAINN